MLMFLSFSLAKSIKASIESALIPVGCTYVSWHIMCLNGRQCDCVVG